VTGDEGQNQRACLPARSALQVGEEPEGGKLRSE
jgi:hypothetical protein